MSFGRIAVVAAALTGFAGGGVVAQAASAQVEVVVRGLDHTFTMVGWLVPLPDGGVLVSYPRENVLRHFGPSGALLGEIGRQGGGPNEFASINGLGARPDGYWVFDRGNSRFTVLDRSVAIVRTVRLAPALRTRMGQPAPYNLRAASAFTVGDTVLFQFQHRGATPSDRWAGLFRVSPDGVVLDELLRIPPDPCFRETTHAGQLASVRVPFCAPPQIAVSPSGDHAVAMRFDDASSPPRLCTQTWSRSRTGRPTERCTPYTPPVLQTGVRDSVVSSLRSKAPSPELARLMTTLGAGRRYHPAYSAVVVSDQGWIIRDEPTNAAQVRWFVEDATGRRLATIVMPRGVVMRAASGEWLWGVRADEDGVEDIVRVRMPTR